MLTNKVEDINQNIKVTKNFANAVTTEMVTKRFGVRSCVSDKHFKYAGTDKRIIEYEKMKLSEMLDGYCDEPICCEPVELVVPPCCTCNDNCKKY